MSTSSNSSTPNAPDLDNDPLLQRIFSLWLPDECRDHPGFVEWATRLIREHNPTTAEDEAIVARKLEGYWRLLRFMKGTAPADPDPIKQGRLRAQTEQSLARTDTAWSKRCRLEIASRAAKSKSPSSPSSPLSPSTPTPPPPPPPKPKPQWPKGLDPPPPGFRNPNLPPDQIIPAGYEPPPELPDDVPIDWRDYIGIDPDYSTEWPVIKGTHVEAETVVIGLRLGLPDEELIARHMPPFNKTILRAVRACDAEGKCGPYDPYDDAPT